MYLCDIHSHTKLSPDSKAELLDTARAAIAAGLQEFCVTDHCDMLGFHGEPVTSFDWPTAKGQYRAVKGALGDRLTLRLGIELGSAPYAPDTARAILAQGGEELDFVLGSLHNWIGVEDGWDLAFSNYRDNLPLSRAAVEGTLGHTWALVTQYPDCYDSLAHCVYPSAPRAGHRPLGPPAALVQGVRRGAGHRGGGRPPGRGCGEGHPPGPGDGKDSGV